MALVTNSLASTQISSRYPAPPHSWTARSTKRRAAARLVMSAVRSMVCIRALNASIPPRQMAETMAMPDRRNGLTPPRSRSRIAVTARRPPPPAPGMSVPDPPVQAHTCWRSVHTATALLMSSGVAEAEASTGIAGLDTVLGGLIPGDNVVWVAERAGPYEVAERAFIAQARQEGRRCIYVTALHDPLDLGLGPDVEIIDARPGRPDAPPAALAAEIERRA